MAIVLRHSLPFNGNSTLLCFSYLGETQLVLCLCKIKTTVQNHLAVGATVLAGATASTTATRAADVAVSLKMQKMEFP